MTQMRKWSIVTAVAVLIVFAAGWFLMVKPQKAKATDLKTQASTQEQQNQVLLGQIAALQNEAKNLPAQQAALQKFTTQVPDNSAEPTIIRQLSAAANGAGVDLISMTPGTATQVVAPTAVGVEPGTTTPGTTTPGTTTPDTGTTSLVPSGTSADTLMALPISIGITGSFANIESFFQSLETLPRALMVSGWSICPVGVTGAGPSSGGGGATCTAPAVPTNKEAALPAGSLGGTLSATIFYAPPASAATSTSSLTGAAPTTTTPTTTTTTPVTTPTTAATPATTGGSTPPAS